MQRRPGFRKCIPEVLSVYKGVDSTFQKPGKCHHTRAAVGPRVKCLHSFSWKGCSVEDSQGVSDKLGINFNTHAVPEGVIFSIPIRSLWNKL